MPGALIWLAVAAALLVAEATSFTLVLCFFALGALAAAAVAGFTDASLLVESLVALGVTLATLPTLRPILRAQVHGRRLIPDAPHLELVGQRAVVTEEVTDHTGQVRVHGVLWRARAFAGLSGMKVGDEVTIAEVEGATLAVYPTELPWSSGTGPIAPHTDSTERSTPGEPPGSTPQPS